MPEAELPDALVALQKRCDQAWADVEAHRRDVDGRRHRDAQAEGAEADPSRPWAGPALRPWNDAEDARHEELTAAARAAGEELRRALAESGLGGGAEVLRGLRASARKTEEPGPPQ
ncbi:hypothetical protein SAMN05216267_10172 [Actinacidiphila rubida]|uniref:Uncharacterized protein n=1 Tax=Actinacidiphila rubida TaxID=310780 RepID=A0A1H8LTZ4_9ACTN|nr:hypothetical protein [Actinacidiphila rubida]SEO08601.1 hypothetical protein SAMN05216267_10172 [Actinacidiphila rubida]